ncbi:MAG: AAA family ATPase [Acidobacteria bacterium]|nr:AAA family ATPase [Acidobacteriota bacterium]
MAQSEYRRLQRIAVHGLFHTYDHEILLNLDDRVTLLHGPNGVGKTVILGMTNALLRERLDYFQRVPFGRFVLEFHDGSTIELASDEKPGTNGAKYKLILTTDGKSRSAKVSATSPADAVASEFDHLRRHRDLPQHWVDLRDGEVLSATQVLARYSEDPPPSTRRRRDDTSWLGTFLKSANAHLIEAQRLVRMDWEPKARRKLRTRGWSPPMISSVVECSADFQARLDDTMVQYGRQSQALDQSVLERLISASDQLTPSELRDRMLELEQKTDDLKKIGILDETPTHPFSEKSLEGITDTHLRVMTLAVLDTANKLSAFDDLARRAGTLLDNVNHKYRHKNIQVDHEEGFVAVSENGQRLPLTSLSSGEQQELVLHYDLLFRVPSNTVVMIDEPELSLHVAWQKRFLPELLETVKLSEFDAVVATHSPFIVGDRDDLMVGLGDAG